MKYYVSLEFSVYYFNILMLIKSEVKKIRLHSVVWFFSYEILTPIITC